MPTAKLPATSLDLLLTEPLAMPLAMPPDALLHPGEDHTTLLAAADQGGEGECLWRGMRLLFADSLSAAEVMPPLRF